ncbi:hypothetical protein LUZ60_017041 [Juncus effusus]|nr:hypothetical protein LUZ60_017041 [Juncus effusus]
MLKSPISFPQSRPPSLLSPSNYPSTSALRVPPCLPRRHLAPRHSRPSRLRYTYKIKCQSESELPGVVIPTMPVEPITVKAVVTIQSTIRGMFAHMGITRGLDDIGDLLGKTLLLKLVSVELDPETKKEKETISEYAHRAGQEGDEARYEGTFKISPKFGQIGAVLVENEHHKEMFVKNIVLFTGDDEASTINVDCESWIHSKFDNKNKRIFFTRKSYLPSQTPGGLLKLREKELEYLRGDGSGTRKCFERIYDYDVYNDLGNPDSKDDMARPVLGGSKKYPYPRRCRTGRARTKKDPLSEKRASGVYIPRDEQFSEVKNMTFSAKTLRSVFHAIVPSIESAIIDTKLGFPYFTAIDSLFNEGVPLPEQEGLSLFQTLVPRIVKALATTTDNVLLFETPEMIERDKFSWFRDEEFSRQTLAGLNPLSIQLLTELPIVSKLDPSVYGSPESLITPELIEREIKGAITAQEAVKQKRLFMLDYHDIFLPYVHKVRELSDTTLYGSRTVFYLTDDGTLMPIAIELTRPKSPTKPQWKKVYTHCWNATGAWLWKLAKAHVCAHDAGYHQLVSHWLRTHCCTEPYIIASNRQLSAMHPIYKLLHPHFRYTMEINALAREYLINAGGIIETSFFPGMYSSELSSVAYDKVWRFDMEALPADLIRRGMAVEDVREEYGLKLTIEDYPYANDGLLIWSSIKQWVSDYVNHYYATADDVVEDKELQQWWLEIRTKGHADKKDEPWWPKLKTQNDLIHILTTIIWVSSGHHAAVNFGQYHYAGYFPNRPTIARKNMPDEDETLEDFAKFWKKPERALLKTFPSQIQATVVMSILDILSSHSPDEEYIGAEPEPAWQTDPVINAAFERFSGKMKEIEGIIDARNADPNLMNRCGAGIVPYELLKPYSEPGVTGMGIPNSISI